MAQSNKLGTFGGVFTPSILTILGVIMFLRLPWIVGQAGLWITIGIILLAHLVSVTSGLSVSSIATDKKVHAGGTYFIISRSLGLPIGGTLGIALFVGLSFSVSLYLIGFSESFLGTWGLEATRNNIRVVGTIALLMVTTLTFISTSLAIKTQYFIMGAIGLALMSFLFGGGAAAPAIPHLAPSESMAPVIVLFAIFFPAVTGFEAGVSMSGDLRDPRKSLPFGTIAAIVVGLGVYLGLAVFFAFRVDPEALVNNPNVLLELSFFPPLVIAGIWGATLSSAIGSILGAPRILQATSSDGITPRTFARGYGRTHEPRNAVLLAFVLAETGILIGELNVIARVVSMFFITTYGFLNLTCSVESWASTDFRPSFRIPRWTSVLGALTCLIIMINLDILATLGATIVLAGLFMYLKRQELRLDTGDTWEGVWSSMARTALHRLNRVATHTRNWRPNIILFSGGTSARPHLIRLGQWLVEKRGVLSNFDLLEQTRADVVFPKMHQSVRTDGEEVPGVFARRLECSDVYESMATVAQVYGFSGLDPNAVMMGWSRQSTDPRRFGLLIHRLVQLDYNILLLDYDVERGFGARERIDVWWGGANNNITLSLAMLKCLLATEEWSAATVRLLTVITDSARASRVHRNMNQILEDQRIDGTVKIINNAVERRSIETIIKSESLPADLIIFGMPNVDEDTAGDFVARTNTYLEDVGSVLLIHASSAFEQLDVGVEVEQGNGPGRPTSLPEEPGTIEVPAIGIADARPFRAMLVGTVSDLGQRLETVLLDYQRCLNTNGQLDGELVESFASLVDRNFETLRKHVAAEDAPRFRRRLGRVRSDFLFQSHSLLERYQQECVPSQQANLDQGIEQALAGMEAIEAQAPDEVSVVHGESDLRPLAEDSPRIKARKSFERIRSRVLKKPASVQAELTSLLRFHVETNLRRSLYTQLQTYGVHQYQFVSDLQKCLHGIQDSLGTVEHRTAEGRAAASPAAASIEEEWKQTMLGLDQLSQSIRDHQTEYTAGLIGDCRKIMSNLYDELVRLDVNRRIRKNRRGLREGQNLRERISEVPALWAGNQSLVLNFGLIDASVMVFENRLNTISQKLRTQLRIDIENNVLDPLTELEASLESFQSGVQQDGELDFAGVHESDLDCQTQMDQLVEDIRIAINEFPETIEIITEDSFQSIAANQFEDVQTLLVSFRRLIDYLTETELTDPLQEEMTTFPLLARKAVSAARDVSRLLSLNLRDVDADGEVEFPEERTFLPATLKTALARLREERDEVAEASRNMDALIQTRLATLSGKLNPYVVSRLAANLGHYIRTEESRKMLSGVVAGGQRIKVRIAKLMVRLLYRRSEGVLAARTFQGKHTNRRSPVASMLTLVEDLSPRPAVLRSLPSYYRELFLGKKAIASEFLVSRSSELQEAERAIRRYREGFRGALLILAEPSGGKDTLCREIVGRCLPRQEIFHLFPPHGGSVDPAVFRNRLREACQLGEDAPLSLPAGSAVIVHELELWSERSPAGMAVIDELFELVDAESERCLFIMTAVTESYRFINRVRPIGDAFLGLIECQPFDAEDLQQAILLRHRPSGFKFLLDGQLEDEISEFRLAMLFNSYFDFSAGRVGVALESWIAHIGKVERDRLVISPPRSPDLSVLEQVETRWIAWIQMFILHRSLTVDRLVRIFRSSEQEVRRDLAVFRRTGMVIEKAPGVLEINPYLEPFVIRKLAEMDPT